MHQLTRSIQVEIHMRQVSLATYLSTLKDFKEKEIHNIIIDTNSEKITILLKKVCTSF